MRAEWKGDEARPVARRNWEYADRPVSGLSNWNLAVPTRRLPRPVRPSGS